MKKNQDAPFTCPHCRSGAATFHAICPECGRPFMRDYPDAQIHPRDPDLTGVCTSRFWAKVLLILILISFIIGTALWLLGLTGLW